jgi:hypothetical protein
MLKQASYLLGLLSLLLGIWYATVTVINYQTRLECLVIAFVFETTAIALFLYSYSLGGWRRELFCQPGLIVSSPTLFFVLKDFALVLMRFATEYRK